MSEIPQEIVQSEAVRREGGASAGVEHAGAPAPESSIPEAATPEAFVLERVSAASRVKGTLARAPLEARNAALRAIAEALLRNEGEILAANARDVQAGRRAGLGVRIDRLQLSPQRLAAIRSSIADIIAMADPLGAVVYRHERTDGMRVEQVRCPLGVVGMIYESRPNVTIDAVALCLKAGNAVVLKGGSDALETNRALTRSIRSALAHSALPADAVQLLDRTERELTTAFLRAREHLDVIIPRGGLSLIRFAQANATVPVIETGAAVVHAYVDEHVDISQAARLAFNAKMRQPSICGALDVLLVHQAVLQPLAEALGPALARHDPPVELRVDTEAQAAFHPHSPSNRLRTLDPARDYDTEFLDYILAIATVRSLDEALEHIRKHSLRHTEAIFTTDAECAARFLAEVDAACVMHNASTQYTDGAEFGLGAEIGISTQKLHVRGPFALAGLTSTKWNVYGTGHLRP